MAKKLVCIGDSIVEGVRNDSKRIGWVGRLQANLLDTTKDDWMIYNLGISGDCIIDIYHRLNSEALARRPDICIVSVGVNDISKDNLGNPCINKERRIKIWDNLLKSLKLNVPVPMVLSILPVNEMAAKDGWPTNQEIKEENILIKSLCDENQVQFWDIASSFELAGISEDFAHPNDYGYEIIAKTIYKMMQQNNLLSE